MNSRRLLLASARTLVPAGIRRPLRWNRRFPFSSRAPFKSHPHRIIVDITSACDLACTDCNRSCGRNQAPGAEHMGLEQIRKFISESIRANRLWSGRCEPVRPEQNGVRIEGIRPEYEGIRLEGGEPTQHPQLLEMVNMLLDYKRDHAPLTDVVVCSHGHTESARRVLASLRPDAAICNSAKTSPENELHCAFNMAPRDSVFFKGHDFSCGCWLPMYYGIGLTRHGYYPHPVCGAIDRVLGFDIGLKELPDPDHCWEDHYRRLCPYCGHYNRYSPGGPVRYAARSKELGRMSPSWTAAYEAYRKRRPQLTKY